MRPSLQNQKGRANYPDGSRQLSHIANSLCHLFTVRPATAVEDKIAITSLDGRGLEAGSLKEVCGLSLSRPLLSLSLSLFAPPRQGVAIAN